MDVNVDSTWAASVQKNAQFALLMLDVDNFKKYNDRYGHQRGDDCLRAVANAIENSVVESNAEGLTKNAFAARYGGEEFAVVIPGASIAAYEKCAARILESVRNLGIPHELNGEWGVVTVSLGGSHRQASSSAAALFREADAALYRAKGNGRNRAELGQ
jgi:diguanylate cyclase (GGDEF)-like protein